MIVEVITTLAAHGTITASRTSRRPGNALLRNWASASEITTVSGDHPDHPDHGVQQDPGQLGQVEHPLR